MEIIPIFSQSVPDLSSLLQWTIGACGVAAGGRALQKVWAVRRLPSVDLPAALSMSALPLFLTPGVIGSPTHGPKYSPVLEIESSPALGERVPLLSPPARAGDQPSRVHPAIHGSRTGSTTEPLFPPASPKIRESLAPWERGAIDLRRSSQRRTRSTEDRSEPRPDPKEETSHHVVVPGDTLWDIAAKVLGTDDQRAIARYWPRIHKENVDVVGRDPNLIRPGQVLSLPPGEDA